VKPIQIDLRIHEKEKKNFLNERKIKQFIQNSCYLFVYLDKSYLLEHLSHQIERMTIKTKFIVEGRGGPRHRPLGGCKNFFKRT